MFNDAKTVQHQVTQNGVPFNFTEHVIDIPDELGRVYRPFTSESHGNRFFLVRQDGNIDIRVTYEDEYKGGWHNMQGWPDRTYQQNSDTILAAALHSLAACSDVPAKRVALDL